MAVVGRRQPLLVEPAATPASTMESAALADLHGTTDTRDNEWFDVVAPSEYSSLLTVTSLVLFAKLVPHAHLELQGRGVPLWTFRPSMLGSVGARQRREPGRPVACGKLPKQVDAKVTYRS